METSTSQLIVPNLPGMGPNKSSWVYREKEGFKRPNSAANIRTTVSANFDNSDHVFGHYKEQENQLLMSGRNQQQASTKSLVRPSTAGPSLGRSASATSFLSNTAKDMPVKLPRYVTTDRQVARFYGYFLQERPWERNGPLGNPAFERDMMRNMVIMMYICDGTIQINEVKDINSGIPQGTFFRRGVIMKSDNQPVQLIDLIPGQSIQMIGREFHITDTDAFTRDFMLKEYDIELPSAQPLSSTINVPNTTSQPLLRELGAQYATGVGCFSPSDKDYYFSRSTDYLVTKEILEKTNRFLKFDGQILRFACVEVRSPYPPYYPEFENKLSEKGENWEDLSNGYGFVVPETAMKYALSYYLSSREVEVVMERARGAKDPGQDIQKIILKRTRLPKDWRLAKKGINDNVFYEMEDFQCGNVVEVYSKYYLLTRCDSYTINSYAKKGMLQKEVTVLPDVEDPFIQPIPGGSEGTLPIGKAEDTLATVYGMPKVRKDMIKVGRNINRNIRCKAKMVTNDFINSSREFLFSYYLEDDSLQIYEENRRNAGIKSGTFLKRGQYVNETATAAERSSSEMTLSPSRMLGGKNSKSASNIFGTTSITPTIACYVPPPARNVLASDIFLGNILCVNGTTFQIIEMDNVSMKFCESYPEEFPLFDFERVLLQSSNGSSMFDKIIRDYRCDLRSMFQIADQDHQKCLDQDHFLLILDSTKLLNLVTDQELLTLLRRFQDDYHRVSPYELVKPTINTPIAPVTQGGSIWYDEFVDIISHLYFKQCLQYQHASRLACYKRNNVEMPKLEILMLIARSRSTQWRKVFRRDPHSHQGTVTLATLIKVFARYQILLSPQTIHEITSLYQYKDPRQAKVILKELNKRKIKQDLLAKYENKVPLSSTANLRDLNVKSKKASLVYNPQRIKELKKKNTSMVSTLRTQVGLSSDVSVDGSTVVEEPADDTYNILIDYNQFCDTMYPCDWAK